MNCWVPCISSFTEYPTINVVLICIPTWNAEAWLFPYSLVNSRFCQTFFFQTDEWEMISECSLKLHFSYKWYQGFFLIEFFVNYLIISLVNCFSDLSLSPWILKNFMYIFINIFVNNISSVMHDIFNIITITG
jgi:hypothetical protein